MRLYFKYGWEIFDMKKYLSTVISAFLFLHSFSGVSFAKTAKQNKTSKKPSKSISVMKLKSTDESKIDYKKLIKNLDKDLVWKMVIDGRYHSKGKYICDEGGQVSKGLRAGREPGYLKAMLGAFNYMVSTIDKEKIDENLFREFHKRALTKVGIRYKFDCTDYWGDENEHASFPIGGKGNTNQKGKEELFEKKKDGWECERELKPLVMRVSNKPGNRLFAHISKTPKESRDFAKLTFEVYHKKLQELKENGKVEGSWIAENRSEEDKKLEIIIRICQCLDQAHTFYDGNIRTIVFLTMNKMLVENDLSPVCMWDPNCLDVMDVETLIGT